MAGRQADGEDRHREQRDLHADGEHLLRLEPGEEHADGVAEAGRESRVGGHPIRRSQVLEVRLDVLRVGRVHAFDVRHVQLVGVQGYVLVRLRDLK